MLLDVLRGLGLLVAEDVRVPVDELGDDAAGDVVDGERRVRVLLGDAGVEDDLEEDVAQLFAQLRAVAGLDRLDQFVRLLDAVLRQALVGLPGGPRALGADAVHDLHEVQQAGAGQVVGGGEQLELRHGAPAGAGQPGEAVGEGGLSLARGHDHHRPASGTRVDQLLGGGGRLGHRYPGLAQIRQLRMGAVRAQHGVGGAQGLPGGPGQQTGGDAVAGGEQDDAAGGGFPTGFGAGFVHDPNVTHCARDRIGLSTGPTGSCDRMTGLRRPAHARRSAYAVTGSPPAVVTSRTHGVSASTRLLFWTSQEP